jgi:hypothetical protein
MYIKDQKMAITATTTIMKLATAKATAMLDTWMLSEKFMMFGLVNEKSLSRAKAPHNNENA